MTVAIEPKSVMDRREPGLAPSGARCASVAVPAVRLRLRRRVAAAILVAGLIFSGLAGATVSQQRYRVQEGDTLAGVAAEFGVDPAAILRASWLADPPHLTAGEVIIIPDPGQSPEAAALDAAAREGTSPWVSGAYLVEAGDTLNAIAAAHGVDSAALAEFNGLADMNTLVPGQRLLIPAARADLSGVPVPNGDETPDVSAASGASFPWVPTYRQERNLSCEYASAYIATSAFGAGIPEWVFLEWIPNTLNPHWGYRGNIDGAWGNYTDYGVYPEPLVPVLNAYGFAGEVFYSWGDSAPLTAHLDAGHPVIVWLALWGDTGITFEDDGTYTVYAGEHVVVAYAYDEAGVYFSDPAYGTYRFFAWDTFLWTWGASGGMSLAVYPW